MFLNNLKSGSRVQIQRESDGPNEGFVCRVEVLIPDSREILVHAPVQNNRAVSLRNNEPLTLRLLTDNAIYVFNATFISHGDIDGFDIIKLRVDSDGEKIQQRSAFRFNCAIPITFTVISSSGQPTGRDAGMISDLSAGGAKIFTDKSLQSGYLLNVSIQLGDELVVAFGDVRSKTELPEGSQFTYQYGVRFAMMPESDQEQIIRYMYKVQREELKKARPR